MIHWGINALNHGSSLTIFSQGNIVVHESCQSDELDSKLIHRAFNYGGPSKIFWYERPWLKKARQIMAGQYSRALDMSVLPRRYLEKINVGYAKLIYTPHHGSHAAAGYFTSPFDDAAIIVLDAIGEFECASIWKGEGNKLKKIWSRNYPHSLGLFYSAFADLIGLTPIKEEGILQLMSDNGDPYRYYHEIRKYFNGIVSLNYNFHKGVGDWKYEIKSEKDRCDIAAAVQQIFEEQVSYVSMTAKKLTGSKNLIYMGGCAFNSKANRLIENQWDKIWSLSNPGDASSSAGAVLYHTRQRVDWKHGIAKHIKIRV